MLSGRVRESLKKGVIKNKTENNDLNMADGSVFCIMCQSLSALRVCFGQSSCCILLGIVSSL